MDSNSNDPLDEAKCILSDTDRHIDSFLDDLANRKQAETDVRNAKETLQWQVSAIPAISTEDVRDILPVLKRNRDEIFRLLPTASPMSSLGGMMANSTLTTASTSFLSPISEIAFPESGVGDASAKQLLKKYQTIQDHQGRSKEAGQLLTDKFPNMGQYFENALKGYESAKNGNVAPADVAASFRTLIDQLQSELYRQSPQVKNKEERWKKMAALLSNGNEGRSNIEGEWINRVKLAEQLTKTFKGGSASERIEVLWSMTLDHIFVVIPNLK